MPVSTTPAVLNEKSCKDLVKRGESVKTTTKNQAFALLFFTFFIWGSVYVGGKFVAGYMHPLMVACLRCTTAMVPLSLMARKHFGTKIEKSDWKYFFIVGFFGYFSTVTLIQLGISWTGPATAALINSLNPATIMLMAAVILKEKITRIKWLCLGLAIAGTLVVTSGAKGEGEMMGILAAVISIFCWGAASVYMRRLGGKYPPILVTTYGMGISLIFYFPIGVYNIAKGTMRFDLICILAIIYLGFVGSGLSQYTWAKCLSVLPASTCSLFYPLQPMFAAILGAVLLKETFHPTFFLGMILITADVVLSTWETKRQS